MPGPLNQSAATYFMYRDSAQAFQDIGLWSNGSATITGRGEPEQVQTLNVTDGTLGVLGVQPALGRGFNREDDLPAGPDVVMISHRYWQRVFSSSPSAVGQSLMLNGRPREVIGVLPAGFRFLNQDPAIYHSVQVQPHRDSRRRLQLPGNRAAQARRSASRRPMPMSSGCCRR